MSSQLRIALAVTFALLFSPYVSTVRAQQTSLTSDQKQVVDTVSTIFRAASTEDIATLDSVIAPDFYIFANGTRFNGDTLMGAIKALHAAGKRNDEHVTEPDVHINGNTAWIAYVNKGSISDASGTVNQNWLESAFLEKQAGTWKIVFMHSTRVPPAAKGNDILSEQINQTSYRPQSHPPYARSFGDTEIVVVSDGPLDLGAPEDSFRGLSTDEIDELLLRSFLPTDKVVIEQNIPLLASGGKRILFETGIVVAQNVWAAFRSSSNQLRRSRN